MLKLLLLNPYTGDIDIFYRFFKCILYLFKETKIPIQLNFDRVEKDEGVQDGNFTYCYSQRFKKC